MNLEMNLEMNVEFLDSWRWAWRFLGMNLELGMNLVLDLEMNLEMFLEISWTLGDGLGVFLDSWRWAWRCAWTLGYGSGVTLAGQRRLHLCHQRNAKAGQCKSNRPLASMGGALHVSSVVRTQPYMRWATRRLSVIKKSLSAQAG
jgi:hypothetical protein